MDSDFQIEIDAPNGLESLMGVLNQLPIELELEMDEKLGKVVLVQRKVSTVAGLYFEELQESTYFFGCGVAGTNPGPPEAVMESFSRALCKMNLSHRITLIIHELDEDEEIINFKASA